MLLGDRQLAVEIEPVHLQQHVGEHRLFILLHGVDVLPDAGEDGPERVRTAGAVDEGLQLDQQIARYIDLIPNPIITVKGLGAVITAGILAEIVDVLRFPEEKHLAQFMGLTWKKRSTGGFVSQNTRLTKVGNLHLRYYFILGANLLRQHALAAGIDPAFVVLEASAQEELVEEVLGDFLTERGRGGEDEELETALARPVTFLDPAERAAIEALPEAERPPMLRRLAPLYDRFHPAGRSHLDQFRHQ